MPYIYGASFFYESIFYYKLKPANLLRGLLLLMYSKKNLPLIAISLTNLWTLTGYHQHLQRH
jgi:hypothetical protein